MKRHSFEAIAGFALGVLLLVLQAAPAVEAAEHVSGKNENGFYVGLEAGISKARNFRLAQFAVNHPTRCDTLLYSDPSDAPTDGACADNSSAALVENKFAPGAGFVGAAAVGYALGNLRFEAEYLNRRQGPRSKLVSLGSGGNDPLATKRNEWSEVDPPSESVSDFNAQHFFLNAYYDFRNDSPWTPYLGGGAGFGLIDMRYRARFTRKTDLGTEEWQQSASGTTSIVDTKLRGTPFGFQAIGGVDYDLTEHTSVGVKVRWTRFRGFKDNGKLWRTLRSHAPVRADGATPFTSDFDLGAASNWAFTVGIKYYFCNHGHPDHT